MLVRLAAKGALARFQKDALASGLVAIPTSPIPPARASGEILKNGTAEVTTFIVFPSCALTLLENDRASNKAAESFTVICFIDTICCLFTYNYVLKLSCKNSRNFLVTLNVTSVHFK